MAKAKSKPAAIETAPEPEPVLPEEEKPEKEVMIDDVLLFERIPEYRFVDENGRMFRFEIHSSGVYWLYPV